MKINGEMVVTAGYGVSDITPWLNAVELAGYGYDKARVATSVLDRLQAVVVTFSSASSGRIAIVSCDQLQIGDGVAEYVRDRALREFAIAGDSLVLLATHSHTSPLTGNLEGCGIENPEYASFVAHRIVDAIAAAVADEAPALSIATCETTVEPPVAFNRTDPNGSIDTHVRGFIIEREESLSIALLSYGCHPVTLGPKDSVSADYPGRVREALSRAGYLPLFGTGFCGDTDPACNKGAWGKGTEETITEYGERIADAFLRGLRASGPIGVPAAHGATGEVLFDDLDRNTIGEIADGFRRGVQVGSAHMRVIDAWERLMFERLEKSLQPSQEFTMRIISIGGVALVALPFECFTAMGDIIRRAAPGEVVLGLGCADCTLCYLPVESEYAKEKSYAARSSIIIYRTPPIKRGQAESIATLAAEELQRIKRGTN